MIQGLNSGIHPTVFLVRRLDGEWHLLKRSLKAGATMRSDLPAVTELTLSNSSTIAATAIAEPQFRPLVLVGDAVLVPCVLLGLAFLVITLFAWIYRRGYSPWRVTIRYPSLDTEASTAKPS